MWPKFASKWTAFSCIAEWRECPTSFSHFSQFDWPAIDRNNEIIEKLTEKSLKKTQHLQHRPKSVGRPWIFWFRGTTYCNKCCFHP